MLSLKILLSIVLTALVYQESIAVNVNKVISKRSAEVSKNVQRYSFNQNHPPFAEEYAPIPVSIVYEEPSRSKGKSVSTTERAPTTFHPKFRNLVVVSADIAKETSTLNSNYEETRSSSTLGSIEKTVPPTVDEKTNIQVKGKYNVESELQIPVAVIYDNEYTNLRGNPIVTKAGMIEIQDHQRNISDNAKLNSNSESQKSNEPRTRSYDKVISRRNPQSPEILDGSTDQISTMAQSKAQPTWSDDTEREPVRAKTQQRRRQWPRIEAENTTGGATAPKTESYFNSDARPALSLRKGNQNIDTRLSSRQKLQPKTTKVNETATEIPNDKSNVNENNLHDSKITPQQNQPTNVVGNDNVKVDNNTVLSSASKPKPSPQRRRRPVTSDLNAKPAVTLQTNESVIAKQNSEKAHHGGRSPNKVSQLRRQQPASDPKPAIKYEITNPETTEKTNNKDDGITQDKQSSTESATIEIIQDQYQNPPQRKQLNNPLNSPNAEKISETQKGSQTMKKGTGFPAIVSTTNSRTQPQRRRQPVRTAKEDAKSDELVNATQANVIEHEEIVTHQTPLLTKAETSNTRSSENRNSEAGRNSRKRDPVVPIIESENHVYGNTGEFHYSYESGDGTKHYGDGVLKPFDEDVNGEAVVGGFSYTDKEGNDFSLTYTADENGYRPVGAHLPTPPPIPPAIARALAYLATKTTPAEYDEVTESL